MIIFSNHWFLELVAMTTSETTEGFGQLQIITELQIHEDSTLTTLQTIDTIAMEFGNRNSQDTHYTAFT